MSEALDLTLRQRASWAAHVFKAVTQDHHQDMGALLRPFIAQDAVIADIGAHAGQFARLFARMAPKGHIHAFEPTSYARSILTQSLGWRGVSNVSVWPVALSDAEGEVAIATPLKRGVSLGFGLAHVTKSGAEENARVERVRAMTLDQFAKEQALTRLDFIKCDIEGWEMRMLTGARETLAKFRPTLFLELNDHHLARAGDNGAGAFALLQSLGYSARVLQGQAFTPIAAYAEAGDFLFTA